jgi:hypothetical protein
MEASAAVSDIGVMSRPQEFVIGRKDGHRSIEEVQRADGDGHRSGVLRRPPGLDQDHRRVDRTGHEGGFHASDQSFVFDVAMGQQDFDQGPGARGVTQLAPGRLPEALVDGAERP